jgi:hypothetical protein
MLNKLSYSFHTFFEEKRRTLHKDGSDEGKRHAGTESYRVALSTIGGKEMTFSDCSGGRRLPEAGK